MALCFKMILINQLHNHNQNALDSLPPPPFHGSQLSNEAAACAWQGNGEYSRQNQTAAKEQGDACEGACKPACTCDHSWVWEPSQALAASVC